MLGLSRVSIAHKLMMLVLLFIIGIGVIGLAAWRTIAIVKVGGPIYDGIAQNKDLIADILPPPEFIIEAHLGAHLLGDTDDPSARSEIISTIARLQVEFETRRAFWQQNLPEGEMKSALTTDSYEPAAEFFRALNDHFIPAVRAGETAKAREILGGPMLASFNRHRAAIDRCVEIASRQSKEGEAAAAATLNSRFLVLAGIATATAIFVVALGWMIAHSIVAPIRRMAQGVSSIGEGGQMDLTKRIDTGTKDELAVLSDRLNTILATLNGIIAEVSRSARSVGQGCGEIVESSEQVARAIDSQSRQTESVSSAVLEANQSIAEVAEKTREAAGLSAKAGKDAQGGGDVVARSLEHMRSISEMVGASSKNIADLGARSDEIGRIIEVINDIADQTNLLALNAAIEAARAGEHGRGFAVVADEVRKLADRTTKATGEVGSSIKAIQSGTSSAVERMKLVSDRVGTGVQLAETAGSALSTICRGSGTVASMIESIASATEEQTSASEEIGRNVTLIAQAGQECTEGARRAASVADELRRRTDALEKLVAGFKVSG